MYRAKVPPEFRRARKQAEDARKRAAFEKEARRRLLGRRLFRMWQRVGMFLGTICVSVVVGLFLLGAFLAVALGRRR